MWKRAGIIVSMAALAAVPVSVVAQVEGPRPTQVLIRAESKTDAGLGLQPSSVQMEIGNKQVQLSNLRPLTGPGAQKVEIALLIDDGLRSNFGVQLQDIESFVQTTVSPNVAIGVGFMQNGRAEFPKGFSTDAEVATKAIRLPLSSAGISGSPYFVVSDLTKHWPTTGNAARVILMITNGIDYYNGSVSPLNQNSPYVDSAIRDAQRAGIPVYSIFYGRREVNGNLSSFSGQSYLEQVAQGTGAIAFVQGTINPVSLKPYFNQFNRALKQSYVATFDLSNRKPERLKVSTTVPDVKLKAQGEIEASGSVARVE